MYTLNSKKNTIVSKTATIIISAVWLINGLFCKLLSYVPRHQEIVSEILGISYAPILTKIIGILEILMAVWVFSKIKSRLNTWLQITIILTMNIIEFTLVPEMLLWGRLNIVFAIAFVFLIYYNEYIWSRNTSYLK